jgi:hypothetical protein
MSPMSDKERSLLRAWRRGAEPVLPEEEVVYGATPLDGPAIFAPRSDAERFARFCRALSSDVTTWGAVRAILRPPEFEELLSYSTFDEADPPPDDEPFESSQIPAHVDGDWPRWPPYDMIDWFPIDIAEEYGSVVDTTFNGPYLAIDAAVADAVAERLRRLGVRCQRDDALTSTMVIY